MIPKMRASVRIVSSLPQHSPEKLRARQKRYNDSEKGKARLRRYSATDKRRASYDKRQATENYIVYQQIYREHALVKLARSLSYQANRGKLGI